MSKSTLGIGSLVSNLPDGGTTGGNTRGANATDLQMSRTAATQVASGTRSVICGGERNTASQSYSTVCGGYTNTASGQYAVVAGGQSNIASQSWTSCLGGGSNSATAAYATAIGGFDNEANSRGSAVIGGFYGISRGIIGYTVFPASEDPINISNGTSQTALLVLGRQTTDATPTVICSDGDPAGTDNQVILPNNSAYYFRGHIVAGVTGAGDTKGWFFEGVIKRGANAGTTAMVGSPTVTSNYADAGASAWSVSVTADTTNGGIKVEVTGAAATTIRWVCKIETTEMTY